MFRQLFDRKSSDGFGWEFCHLWRFGFGLNCVFSSSGHFWSKYFVAFLAFQEFCICQFPFVWNSAVICIDDLVMERFNWIGRTGITITISCQLPVTCSIVTQNINHVFLIHVCWPNPKLSPRIYQPRPFSTDSVLTKSNSHWIGFTLMAVKSAVVDIVQNYIL